jgi:hypothetical protein
MDAVSIFTIKKDIPEHGSVRDKGGEGEFRVFTYLATTFLNFFPQQDNSTKCRHMAYA